MSVNTTESKNAVTVPPAIHGTSQSTISNMVKALNAVYEVTQREIQLCSKSARNHQRLWCRKDSRAFGNCLNMRISDRMAVTCGFMDSVPVKGMAMSAIRSDGTRSAVVYTPLPDRSFPGTYLQCQTGKMNIVSFNELEQIVLNHLRTENTCLQLYSSRIVFECSENHICKDSRGTLDTSRNGYQIKIPTANTRPKTSPQTESSETQTCAAASSCGCQADPLTSDAGCQIAPIKVDAACQTEGAVCVNAAADMAGTTEAVVSDRSVSDMGKCATLNKDITFEEEGKEKEVKVEIEEGNERGYMFNVKQNLHDVADEVRRFGKEREINLFHTNVEMLSVHCQENNFPKHILDTSTYMRRNCQVLFEDIEVDEYDVFAAGENQRISAVTEELSVRYSDRNELSFADELALLGEMDIKNGTESERKIKPIFEKEHGEVRTVGVASVQFSITTEDYSSPVAASHKSSVKATKKTHHDDSPVTEIIISDRITGTEQTPCPPSAQNLISDEVLVRVFGFDPANSPFQVTGYPVLAGMKDALDHLELPVIDKKLIQFTKRNDGLFHLIGQGAYGCVYLAQLYGHKNRVVVKEYICNEHVTMAIVEHEARMLKYLSDTGFVAEFLGLVKSGASVCGYSLVQEYFGDGVTIFNLLTEKESQRQKTWFQICYQLAIGLEAIHAKHILLNDIKCDNVLVDLDSEVPRIKYIDVGMATYRHGLQFRVACDHDDAHGYLAPEVCMGCHSTPLSDIYSLGFLLQQIGRRAKVEELMDIGEACSEQLPIARMSLKSLQVKFRDILVTLDDTDHGGG